MKSTSPIPLVIALALLVAAAAGYFFWYGQVTTLSTRAATLSAELSAKRDDAARLAAAKATLAAITSDTESVDRYFVASGSIVPFLEQLQATGKGLGSVVDIASVSADLTSAQPRLTISLKIEGAFDAVMRTLGSFEYAARDITVNDLSLSAVAPGRWAATGTLIVGSRTPAKSVSVKSATSTP